MARRIPSRPLITIIGTTGTGKSQLAVDLATQFNGEIVNADAMQLYDGLPIITNKIPGGERKNIPHHLLGCIGLDEEPWSVDKFVPKAIETIGEIHSRGKLPILVGGTNYYLQSLLFGNSLVEGSSGPDEDYHTDKVEKWPILGASTAEMMRKLEEVDPIMAQRWHPKDSRKIQRSLEIWLKTGKKASDIYAEQRIRRQAMVDNVPLQTSPDGSQQEEMDNSTSLRFPSLLLWTHTPRECLVERLNTRVDQMMKNGLLQEIHQMDSHLRQQTEQAINVDKTRGIWASIGFKEFEQYLVAEHDNAGDSHLDFLRAEAVERTKSATRRYAKTQIKWIRIKLANALQDFGMTDHMFLLDTSDPGNWEKDTLTPASGLCEAFLAGSTLPDPLEANALARDVLTPKRDYDLSQRANLWKQRTCEACNVVAVTEESWKAHVEGRRHRLRVKSIAAKHI